MLYLDAGTTCQEVVPLLAARTVDTLNIDLAFLSTGAWDLLHGVTSHSSDKVLLKQAVMRSAASVTLLADSTKWGDVERFAVARLDEFDSVVTDAGLPSEVVDSIEARGPKALRAE
ncbi:MULTISPECIES: hypothetical protein [unclassified Streptomyces]|uniref:hypothetical protein n=1 Tax=unclassified Streptomyces TaxID=2593676 RepID=UPI002E18B2EC